MQVRKLIPDIDVNDWGKLPPQDKDLELSVLGTILINPDSFHEVAIILHPEVFYVDSHQRIYKAMEQIHQRGGGIDLETLVHQLKKTEQLEAVGGPYFIATLCHTVSREAYIVEKSLMLKELYFKRKMIGINTNSIKNMYEDTSDVFDEMSALQIGLEGILGEISKIGETSFGDIVAERAEELKEAGKSKTYKTGITCGLDWLDRQTNGFQATDLIIVAARPSMGKTTFAIDSARKQAKNGNPIGIFSLEMSDKQLIDKMLSQSAEIDNDVMRKGGLHFDQWQRFDESVLKLMEYPVYMCDTGGIGINELCAKAKLWKLKYGIKMLYVDYIQLIDAQLKNRNREQEVGHLAERLKGLAKELHIPVMALSQLSRKIEERSDKRPVLSDLRESGSLEQAADMVIFLHRPDVEKEEVELIIAKYRNGKTGFNKVIFNKQFQKFIDSTTPF